MFVINGKNMVRINKGVKLKLVISLARYFFSITFFIAAPIFFTVAASNLMPYWIKAVLIYLALPAILYSLLKFFYKRKLKEMGLTHDPLNVRFFSMGNGKKLTDKSLDK